MKRTATPPVLVTSILLILVVLGSVLFLLQMHPRSFRASLPPDTSGRPPFIIATNPYSVQSVAVGTTYHLLLASLKSGYATRLSDGTLDTLPISANTLPPGMTIDPVTIDVPVGTSTQRVQVRELTWNPSTSDIGDHPITLTSSITINGTTYAADPLSLTFRVFNPSLSLTNEQVLAEVVSRHFTTATSVNELLQAITFDDALQNMTSDELLHTLITQGIITRYPSYEALIAALPLQAVDLTNLKPYGILQALATPPKGGTILRQKDAQKPWMIVQNAYDDLRMTYDANPFLLLNHYESHHLLTFIDDRIALPSGSQDTIPVFATAKPKAASSMGSETILMAPIYPGRNYQNGETEAQYRAGFPALAQKIKVATDAMPEGQRVIKLQGIERLNSNLLFDGVFPPLRSSTGALVESQGYFPTNYDCTNYPVDTTTCPEGPPTPTGCIDGTNEYKKYHCLFSLWTTATNPEENWYNTVRSRLSEFFRIYKSIGGKVDYIITDMETDWFSMYFSRRIWFSNHEDHILNDTRWPALAQEFIDKGIGTKGDGTLDLTGIQLWFAHQDWRSILWDAVMARRLAKIYNETMYDPIRFDVEQGNAPLFPDVKLTDYEFFYRSMLSPSGGYGVFPRNVGSVGDLFGTHQSLSAYADFYPFTLPPGLETDTPNQPQTLFGTFMNDVKHARTFPLSSRAPSDIWIAHPYWRRYAPDRLNPAFTEPPLQEVDDWFMERMFHLGLSGISGYLNWTGNTLDDAIFAARGSYADFDRGFDVMTQGKREVDARIGYSDRTPLTMRRVDFQDGYALSGMEVHGKRVYRFTPDPDVPSEVRTVGDGIELWSNGIRIASIPHAIVQQNYKGYWITQFQGRNMLTATPDEILNALQ